MVYAAEYATAWTPRFNIGTDLPGSSFQFFFPEVGSNGIDTYMIAYQTNKSVGTTMAEIVVTCTRHFVFLDDD